MTAPDDADNVFEPSAEAQTALSSSAFEGTNVCRAAALSSLLQEATVAMSELSTEQRSLGFSEGIIEQAGRTWDAFDAFDGETDLAFSPDGDLDAARVRRWIELNETANPRPAVSFLIAMLGSGLERESAAAAAALWRGLNLQNGQWPPPGAPRWRIFDRLTLDLDDVLSDRLWGPWWWQEQGLPIIDSEPPQEVVAWDADRWQMIFLRLMFRLGWRSVFR
jgi:hypothetical protein